MLFNLLSKVNSLYTCALISESSGLSCMSICQCYTLACNIYWKEEVLFPQFASLFSRLICIFIVIYGSKKVLSVFFDVCKKSHWGIDRVSAECVIYSVSMDILTTLIHPVYKPRIYFYFCLFQILQCFILFSVHTIIFLPV